MLGMSNSELTAPFKGPGADYDLIILPLLRMSNMINQGRDVQRSMRIPSTVPIAI